MDKEIRQGAGEDTELIEAFRAGGVSAFDKLVLKYKDLVFNICFRFMGNYEDANDCAQDTFVKVYRSLNGFKGQSQFSTWLYTVAVNTCKNKLRSPAKRYSVKMVSLDKPVETDDGEASFQLSDGDPSPAEELEKKDKEARVQQALDSLDEKQKELIILRDIQDLSYEEIASITGNNLGTVKSKLSRARSRLKDILKEVLV